MVLLVFFASEFLGQIPRSRIGWVKEHMCVSFVRCCQIPSVGIELNVNTVQKWRIRPSTPSVHTWWLRSLPMFYPRDRLARTSYRNTQALGVVEGTIKHHRLYFAWNNSLRGSPVHLRLSRSSEWFVFCVYMFLDGLDTLQLSLSMFDLANKMFQGMDPMLAGQSFSHVQLFSTPWSAACQASLSITLSQSLLKLMSTESMMLSNHLDLCLPLLLLPAIFSKHQNLFQWVRSSHQMAKLFALQL